MGLDALTKKFLILTIFFQDQEFTPTQTMTQADKVVRDLSDEEVERKVGDKVYLYLMGLSCNILKGESDG